MIDTPHLVPPELGPRSNPLLYGVAESIAELFPLAAAPPRRREDDAREPGTIASAEAKDEMTVGD